MSSIDDIAVLTSENVRLNYTLAGMGSRIAAFLADAGIIILSALAVTFIFMSFSASFEDIIGMTREGISLVSALYIMCMFLLLWGYHFFFEWINWGQTPGKQLLGIRVAAADGGPADILACALRNVIRILDLGLAVVGVTFFVMIFTPRYQRLGDLAAGTVVVKRRRLSFEEVLYAARMSDRRAESIAAAAAASMERTDRADSSGLRIRIDDSERALLQRFMERRHALPPDVRHKLANDLARRIRARVPGDAIGDLPDERIIETALALNSNPNP